MAQGYLLPALRLQFFTTNGLPLAGGLLHTYAAGTSTPLATYSDAALSSPNANPIVLSASGQCTLFVPAGTLYKLDLTDSLGVEQPGYPLDGIEATPAAGSAPDPPAPVPTGALVPYTAASAPSGFLLCDGSAVSRATFAALFAVCGALYGAGNGSTTFNVPDMRGNYPVGKAAAGTAGTLGGTFGAIDHTHTGPSHTHGVTVPRDGWGSALNLPAVTGRMDVGNAAGVAEFASAYQSTADQALASDAGGTGATGTANPPSVVFTWLIKT